MMITARLYRNGWRPMHLAMLVGLLAAAIVVAWQAWADLAYQAWRDEESSHILLVPVVAAWLIWIRRARFQRLVPLSCWVGTLIVAGGWLLYSTGDTYLVETFWYLGAILLAAGAVMSVGGREVFLRFMPVFGVLLFLIPIPGTLRPYIAGPLQTATAAVVQWLFMVMGFPVSRSGNLLMVNNEPIAIAEACNGLRMVFALILVTYAFTFSIPLRSYVRVILLVVSPLLAIACNVIRLVPTLWAYGHMPHDYADLLHDVGGWAMLFVALLLLIGLLRLMEWMELPVTTLSRIGR